MADVERLLVDLQSGVVKLIAFESDGSVFCVTSGRDRVCSTPLENRPG